MEGDSGKRVCIIGAVIAGLVTAKVLKEDGFDVALCKYMVWGQSTIWGVVQGMWPGTYTNVGRLSKASICLQP
jgi:cation diffusion facilitator CzcD-associated flavoprotein CzcO